MKLATRLTIGVALAIGVTGVAFVAPVSAAKKEKAAAGPQAQLSKEFRAAVGPIEADIKAGKLDGMIARLDAASAQFKMPDEQFYLGAKRYDVAKTGTNAVEQRKAVVQMIDSKSSLITNLAQLNGAAGQYAFNAKDYPDALTRLNEAVRLGSNDADTFIIMAEAAFQSGKVNEGLAFADRAVNAKKTLGQKAPEDWYRRPLSVAYKAKLQPQIAAWSRAQAGAYPTPENWRTALFIYKDSAKLDGQSSLDIMRLMRANKALTGERDYFEYAALASERGLPGEAKSVIDQGLASGTISKSSRPLTELLGIANAKVPGDLASLAAAEKRANGEATGKLAAGTADAYLGYGQDAKAVPLYRLALQKGSIDVDAVNTRLGIALARQGQKAEARTAFAAVTGPRVEIAKFWLMWLDQTV